MSKSRIVLSAVAMALAGTFAVTAFGQQPPHIMSVTPKELKWDDTPLIPGGKVTVIEGPLDKATPFTLRLKMPANSRIAPHFHTAIEHVTVISGTFNLGHGTASAPGR